MSGTRVWIALGVEDHSTDDRGTKEESSTGNDETDGPVWDEGVDVDDTLVTTVGEVVVTGGHVEELSGVVHLDETGVETLGGGVEFLAVVDVLVTVLELRVWQATGLSEVGEVFAGFDVTEQQFVWVGRDPIVGDWFRVGEVFHLHDVGTVGSGGTFSCISCWVGVTSGPLEVDVVTLSEEQELWCEFVFGGWIGLDDVSTFSGDVQVVDTGGAWDSSWTRQDTEHVGTILEGTTELGGIDGEFDWVSILGDGWVLFDWRVWLVLGVICKSGDWVVELFWVGFRVGAGVGGGDVVTDTKDTLAFSGADTIRVWIFWVGQDTEWPGDVNSGFETGQSISKMVVTSEWSDCTFWFVFVPGWP